jgi:hypothetical protein
MPSLAIRFYDHRPERAEATAKAGVTCQSEAASRELDEGTHEAVATR